MSELDWKPAYELVAMIKRRELQASELMAAAIARIEAINPRLNAFCALRTEHALEEARALDERITRGEELGPLAGLPLGVKDLEDVAGLATTYGSKPFKNNVARVDGLEVARLKAAGAIVIGKTNTPEFGFTAFTRNLLFGVTRNPWNLERTPGGSSGGSAAAIAGGMVPLATASDWGGSIRIPACYTGAYGIKPTQGRIPLGPRLGMTQWADFAVVGPITRTVTDAALYLDAAVGYDPADASSLPHPGISYRATLRELPRKLRIAFHPDFGYAVEPEVRKAVAQGASVFRELGHSVTVIEEPVIETCDAWRTIGSLQTLANLGHEFERHPEEFGRAFMATAQRADRITWREYGDAYCVRSQFNEWMRGLFERYDLLLTPTLPTTAFGASGPPPSMIDGKELKDGMEALVFTYPFNLSGHPAASVRAGLTAEGLPCGMQIVAERMRDDLVLQASYAFEQARPWHDQWPAL